MSALNSVHSSSNLTDFGQNAARSSAYSLGSKNTKIFTDSNLNFKMTYPSAPEAPKTTFNTSGLKFNLTIPSNLQQTTSTVFTNTVTKPTDFSGRIKADNSDSSHGILGPLVLSGAEVIADFSGHIRQTFSSSKTIFGTENPAALAALGFTSGFSIVSGGLNIKNGIREIKKADKISDVGGKAIAGLKIARGAAFATGGASLIPARALSIAALSTSAKIVSTMAGVFGTIGGGLFSIGSCFAAISLGIRLNEHRQFRQDFQAILKDPNLSETDRPIKALEHLKKLANVSPEEKANIVRDLEADAKYTALNPQEKAAKVSEEEKFLLKRKKAFLSRVIGNDCLDMIRQKGPAEALSVMEAVQKESTKKVVLSSLAMALVSIGLALTVASFIFTGPTAIIITTALGLAVSLGWILLDGYGLIQEFQKGEAGRFDKLWIFLSTIIAVISVALVFFLSGGIAPIIAASVVGAIWLGINAACYWRIYQLEKKKEAQEELSS